MRRLVLAPAAAVALAVAGCSLGPANDDELVIGVKADQPGLGLLDARTKKYDGFDVAMAREIAKRLGYGPGRVVFRTTPSSVREAELKARNVDLIVASYSITPKRKTQVTFAGPYYVAHQDTLVRADDRSIGDVRDLAGKRICAVTGSNSWRRVTEERGIAARGVETPTYGKCMDRLDAGEIDAVSTDDLILAGLAAGRRARIVNAPFTDEKYGIGLPKGDLARCEAVNRALTEIYQDGTATRLLHRWFRDSGLNVTTHVPQFEGCS
ncbi:glutamate ABC transporter substrate-binding protein [Actinomadura flavalba]|uniref:glutamate ABC transporter substrate-binding protein n=1 Tax=Actinomadura flavalba TaxID=1120938 RepID=UPI0003A382A1|nr:glutamate ABC transporter substrate-binding protein [Actinomadura flavalba]